jgi:anti-anti-sigma factor
MKGVVRAVSHALTGDNAFSARLEPHGETVVVEASGDLDLSVADTFEDEVRKALSNGTAEVVLDLARVTFIDSTGLRALVRVAEGTRHNGVRLSIRRDLSPPVKRLLDLTCCGDHLAFTD